MFEKTNPGALAGAAGACRVETVEKSLVDDTSKPGRSAMSLFAKDPHKRVVRMLGYALTLATQDAWWGLVPVLMTRLTVQERAALAFITLKALNRDDATMTAEAALCAGAGQPQAPLIDFVDQAAFWADLAEPEELEAYCLASFNAMPRGRQAAFLDHVQGRQAA